MSKCAVRNNLRIIMIPFYGGFQLSVRDWKDISPQRHRGRKGGAEKTNVCSAHPPRAKHIIGHPVFSVSAAVNLLSFPYIHMKFNPVLHYSEE